MYLAEVSKCICNHWVALQSACDVMRGTGVKGVPLMDADARKFAESLNVVLSAVRSTVGQLSGSKAVSICSTISTWERMMKLLEAPAEPGEDRKITAIRAALRTRLNEVLATTGVRFHEFLFVQYLQRHVGNTITLSMYGVTAACRGPRWRASRSGVRCHVAFTT